MCENCTFTYRTFKSTISVVRFTDAKRSSVYKRWPSRVFPAYFKYFIYFGTIEGWAVTQLFEALRYKPQGRRFDCRWDHLIELILAAAILHCVRFNLWTCNSRRSFRSLQGIIYLFVRTEYIMDFMWGRKFAVWRYSKIFFSINRLPITMNCLKNLIEVLIDNPESSLRMNYPEWIKWMKKSLYTIHQLWTCYFICRWRQLN